MTANDALAIGHGTRVTLHFSLLLESGEEVDGTRRGRPATFEVGDGNLLPGFEAALFGLSTGDEARIPIPPERAFGEHRRENVRLMNRERFRGVDLTPGVVVSFTAADGELPGVIRRVLDSAVEVDFNHPLAGRHILFDVSILKVEKVGEAERADDPSSGQ